MNEVLMQHLSWVAYRNRVLNDRAIVLPPCGALEQHGPHLPLGTDALLSTAVATDVARKIGGIVAPAFNYGYKSQPKCGGGQHFRGTTSLDGNNLSQMTRDVIREFARHGVRRLALIDGHYENQWFLSEGIDLAIRDLSQNGTRMPSLRVVRLESGVLSSARGASAEKGAWLAKEVTCRIASALEAEFDDA
jgi:creatinine amidohydrolase